VFASALAWLSGHAVLIVLVNLSLGLLGVPAVAETMLLSAGVVLARGGEWPFLMLGAAVVGSGVGMTTSFEIGRFGNHLLAPRLFRSAASARRVARLHQWSDRFGPWSIVLAFFTPGLRHMTAFALGATRIECKRFVAFTIAGACAWSMVLVASGYALADGPFERTAAWTSRGLATTMARTIRAHLAGSQPSREIRRLRGDAPMPGSWIAINGA
jgi:membrane protein DedA with SNARE-associated domain